MCALRTGSGLPVVLMTYAGMDRRDGPAHALRAAPAVPLIHGLIDPHQHWVHGWGQGPPRSRARSTSVESRWVAGEWHAYLNGRVKQSGLRIVLVRLDDTPLPTLVADYRGYDSANSDDPFRIAHEVMNGTTRSVPVSLSTSQSMRVDPEQSTRQYANRPADFVSRTLALSLSRA